MSRRPLILVADDAEDIRNLFGVMLKSKYDVRFAVDSDVTLAGAMEYREGGLTNPVLRVGEYVELLSQSLGLKGKVVEILAQAAPLYDIGKMGVSEHILRKSDKLNDKEWEEVRKHPEIGAGIIGEHKDPLLEQARVMALTHHERWDGTGYPKKLQGDAIPVPGRIMAVADAFERR